MFRIEVIGNIGADAKVVSVNGNEFVSFSVAHSDKHNENAVTWISVNMNNTKLAQYLLKGTKVFVRGNASVKTYKNEQGITMCSINVYASEVEFCSSKSDSSQQQNNEQQTQQPSVPSHPELKKKEEDGDLPL